MTNCPFNIFFLLFNHISYFQRKKIAFHFYVRNENNFEAPNFYFPSSVATRNIFPILKFDLLPHKLISKFVFITFLKQF